MSRSSSTNNFEVPDASINEKEKGFFYGPAKVVPTIFYDPNIGDIPLPVLVKWNMEEQEVLTGGGAAYGCIYLDSTEPFQFLVATQSGWISQVI